MCLAIPGVVETIFESDGIRMSKVNFGGIKRSACLEYTPEAKVGDYVLVHVGFALSVIDEKEAFRTLAAIGAQDVQAELAVSSDGDMGA
ncbi:MAG TPA: HypC/HybG/HupF family hydrogenase formation chaperone [Candidatus Melainabacteria bacterium]|jgi:hydrogenase expression/formation protein HypC|nr:HypC/HybG/HupF family hydrogenase formation chaperone [Candidatus Melainabacteria bacterium]HIN64359.1 HypC/HybG/HupF family hydrogenase formation chaperone [Candidatus Obscuribacterales bacterium]